MLWIVNLTFTLHIQVKKTQKLEYAAFRSCPNDFIYKTKGHMNTWPLYFDSTCTYVYLCKNVL